LTKWFYSYIKQVRHRIKTSLSTPAKPAELLHQGKCSLHLRKHTHHNSTVMKIVDKKGLQISGNESIFMQISGLKPARRNK